MFTGLSPRWAPGALTSSHEELGVSISQTFLMTWLLAPPRRRQRRRRLTVGVRRGGPALGGLWHWQVHWLGSHQPVLRAAASSRAQAPLPASPQRSERTGCHSRPGLSPPTATHHALSQSPPPRVGSGAGVSVPTLEGGSLGSVVMWPGTLGKSQG